MIKDNLKILRESFKISQRELGRRIHMSGQYIAQIEKGERNPTHKTLEKIALALHAELSELLERPNLIGEIFLNIVHEKGISHAELVKQCKLSDSDLKSIFVNFDITKPDLLDSYYSVGKYLGLDSTFLERRKKMEPEIINSITDSIDPYKLYYDISASYDSWLRENSVYNFDFHKYFNRTSNMQSQDNFSLGDINNLLRSTLVDILRSANSSTVLNYGLDDFSPDEIDELINFVFNSFKLKINELLEKHEISSLQKK
ncbi:helix-turn-helix domain protein [Clostridium sp. DL-VIII]|uniref:helix-turn-helix domain-containing protein n=1 Tax=Clostridium sp. DL-VIII TaxID=641107 RepID=UPI00023B03DC|nr:helix-turn-helix transcriptional regulator [Clostridium sp. DL-VIII]EHJ02393.1 helix-turn-helix domain protein [Clostridium sp. DL-VIII]